MDQSPTPPSQHDSPSPNMQQNTALIVIGAISLAVISAFLSYYATNTMLQTELQNVTKEKDALANQVKELTESKQKEAEKKNVATCVDSDGGQDHSVNGTIQFREMDSSGSVIATSDVSDDCVDTFIGGENKNALREYYCDANNNVQYEHFVCPTACVKGICIPEVTTTN